MISTVIGIALGLLITIPLLGVDPQVAFERGCFAIFGALAQWWTSR